MKHCLKILFLLVFVSVQFVDTVFLDMDEAAASEAHEALGLDFDEPIFGHDFHCGCDIFHHLSSAQPGDAMVLINASATKWALSSELTARLANGPPVPPPLA